MSRNNKDNLCIDIYELNDGLKVVFEQNKHLNAVTVGVWIKVGSRDEDKYNNGIAHMIEHMLFKGTKSMSAEELVNWAEENKLNCHAWFFSSDLTFFVKGGRVSKTSGFVGNLLNICPLLNINFEGKLIPRLKIRTKKKAIIAIVDKMVELAENGTDYDGKCYICHSACYDDAKAVADLVKEKFPKLNGDVLINSIGTTIGSHTGPGTVALFYWGTKRED